MAIRTVEVAGVAGDRLAPLVGPERARAFADLAEEAQRRLDGRIVWNVNSTASGGGVAEMLQVLLAQARGVGVDTRWLVIEGDPSFFAVTKRIHNRLHGTRGDAGDLGPVERGVYESVLEGNTGALRDIVRPDDVVVLHDPQTAGLAAALRDHGPIVVWRCHVGTDRPNEWSEGAWAFLRPYLDAPHAHVFSRATYRPAWLPVDSTAVIAPSIEPFSAKNQDLAPDAVRAILATTGLVEGDGGGPACYMRRDGTEASVGRRAEVTELGPPPASAPLVVQVSRWDRLKDMEGVMRGFAEHVAGDGAGNGVHLTLAGPSVRGVADDPEGAEVLEECIAAWKSLPHEVRARVHLASLPTDDVDENAAMVNALQRHATVVVQKSLVEGFGLTVAEAMWKSRPVVGSAVGGIQDQIDDGRTGVLVHDPTDLAELGSAVRGLLADRARAAHLGEAAREKVRNTFLADRHLAQWAQLLGRLL